MHENMLCFVTAMSGKILFIPTLYDIV